MYENNITIVLSIILSIVLSVFTYYFGYIATFTIPLVIILLYVSLKNPVVPLYLLTLTSIIKGILTSMVPFFSIVDLSLLIVLLLFVSCFIFIMYNSFSIVQYQQFIIPFILFSVLILFSMNYTPSISYGTEKASRFLLFNVIAFLSPLVFTRNEHDIATFIKLFIYTALLLTGLLLSKFIYNLLFGNLLEYLVRYTLFTANPIQVSRYISIAATVILAQYLFQPGQKQKYRLYLILFMILGIIISGSRGPLLSFLLSVIVMVSVRSIWYSDNKAILFAGSVLVITLLFIVILPENYTSRFEQISSGQYFYTPHGVKRISTLATRFQFWSMSFKAWTSSIPHFLGGLGVGGFSSLFIWRDFQWYPHNIFFEIMVEFGFFGIALFLWLIFSYGKVILHKISNNANISPLSLILVFAFINMFIAAQFSGDLVENRLLWLLWGGSIAGLYQPSVTQ